MHRSIDMKSVLIGGLLVALFFCLAGAVPFAPPEEYGRFQIDTNDGQAFLLDSATGQVWSSRFLHPNSTFIAPADPNFHAPKILHGSEGI